MAGLARSVTGAVAALLLAAAAGCGQAEDDIRASAETGHATTSESSTPVASPTAHGRLTSDECPDAMVEGIRDYFEDTPVEPWEQQADRYVRMLVRKEHSDATTRRITDQTAEGLEVSYFKPTGQRVARLWFRAYKDGWRLEITQVCVSSPPPTGMEADHR